MKNLTPFLKCIILKSMSTIFPRLETTQLDATNYLSFNQNDSDNKVNGRLTFLLNYFSQKMSV